MSAAALAMLLQAMPAPPHAADAVTVDQLPDPARRGAPARKGDKASVAQLPGDLQPGAAAPEESLAQADPTATPSTRNAAEVARAIGVIRGRGQQPTPELLAREVGPDVLDAYLAQGNPNAAVGAVDTGAAARSALPPGVTLIPRGGPK